jgi:hypothetical protein
MSIIVKSWHVMALCTVMILCDDLALTIIASIMMKNVCL